MSDHVVLVPGTPNEKSVVLKRPGDAKHPEISLFVLAKNAEQVIERLLDNVGPYIEEVVLVLNDTTDLTAKIVASWCEINKKDHIIIPVTYENHPELYILDTKSTYDVGKTLCGEDYDGPFTEVPILAKWDIIRNLGWQQCTRRWRLFLDADDMVIDPQALPGLIEQLEEHHVELCHSRYFHDYDTLGRPRDSAMRERLAINKPEIRWIFPIHEVLTGTQRICHLDGNFNVRDMKDNKGLATRIPGRNFKILYHMARTNDWDVSPRTLVNLIMEVRHMTDGGPAMLEFAKELLKLYLSRSTWPEEKCWACTITAEMCAKMGEPDEAIRLFHLGLENHPAPKTAWLLAKAYFDQGKWEDVIAMFNLGVEHKTAHQTLNDGPLDEDKARILVASSYHSLGKEKQALENIELAMAAFPGNLALSLLKTEIEEALGVTQEDDDIEEQVAEQLSHAPGAQYCPECGYPPGDLPSSCSNPGDFHK